LNGFQWDGSVFIQDDENAVGGKHSSVRVTMLQFTCTYCSIASTRNGYCELEGFCSNSLLMRMHVLSKTA
jgi:hypothetical protein